MSALHCSRSPTSTQRPDPPHTGPLFKLCPLPGSPSYLPWLANSCLFFSSRLTQHFSPSLPNEGNSPCHSRGTYTCDLIYVTSHLDCKPQQGQDVLVSFLHL